ncbi:LmbE family N-acetylglucosaminyl deacetylase [Paenibacillus forsythiae]|uniref:LmbE family N-acetylglucosaminyl deacetylase n=1 Tax=Paenibacillus forsythiae TaxID=365616 RepID=A0ABU3H6B0_9BACL|nr:PIG-L family deacetylase [Paenibacillus forsythiae]MDT3426275.1 LmbE family N-acetylglucosaminyl deacetylase [Paenibacillus forsythiae]
MSRHVLFISAHLDDAILSCGDYIDALIHNNYQVTIATVFTGMGTNLSMLARILHKKFGLGTDTMDVRRQEDIHAAGALGASVLHLNLLECIYRKNRDGSPVYSKLDELFNADWSAEHQVVENIVSVLSEHIPFEQYAGVYVPLGIGRHIDHCLVRRSAERCGRQGGSGAGGRARLFYYEDLPYLWYNHDLTWRTELAGGLSERPVKLRRGNLIAKINAALKYSSQISLLWTSRFSMLRQMARHARASAPQSKLQDPSSCGYFFRVYTVDARDPVPLGESLT